MYYTDFLEVKNDENCKNINQKDKTFFIGDAKYTYDKTNGFYPMYDPNNPLRDIPFFEGRGNIGAISLNLPLIFEEAKVDSLNFFDHLIYYLELIRNLHKRTKIFIEKKNKTINEFAFIYGGIKDVSKNNLITTKSFSASFGVTALNELQIVYNRHTIREEYERYLKTGKNFLDKTPEIKKYDEFDINKDDPNIFFCLEVMRFITSKLNEWKAEDGIAYTVYGTPAETLSGLQARKFIEKFSNYDTGLPNNIKYFSNSFHCHVSEEITVAQKQDFEKILYPYFPGGRISYGKYPLNYNRKGIEAMIKRALNLGEYCGVNFTQAYCNNCGFQLHSQGIEADAKAGVTKCPKCGSRCLTLIERNIGYLSKVASITSEDQIKEGQYTGNVNKAKLAEINDRKSM